MRHIIKATGSLFAWGLRCIVWAGILASSAAAHSQEPANIESTLHGFPALLNSQGKKIADGEFLQWRDKDILHVTIDYNFDDGRRIEEKTSFRQAPEFSQEEWSWSEFQNGQVSRRFEVDFESGKATAEKRMGGDIKRLPDLKIPDTKRTFAGIGFVLAIKNLRERLFQGEKIQLQAVGFLPKPRLVSVQLSYRGLDQMNMANRTVKGDCFVIHPKLPAIEAALVAVKDSRIWLTTPPAVGFLRSEGPLLEPNDPVIRVDLLPGERSGPAEPFVPARK